MAPEGAAVCRFMRLSSQETSQNSEVNLRFNSAGVQCLEIVIHPYQTFLLLFLSEIAVAFEYLII